MSIGDLIRLLSDGNYHSGQQLGERLGVSRTAVWKQLKKLEAMDLPLEAVKGRGYRLVNPLESLDGACIVSRLSAATRRHLKRLFVEDVLDSTNTFLRDRFRHGAGHGEVCLAESQTAGRGRRGKVWSTSWGASLILSVGWRFESGVAALEGLSLAVGVVLANVASDLGVDVALKWPNDVLLAVDGEWQKLAGILLEVTGDVEGPCEVVIGIGLNVSASDTVREAAGQPVGALADVVHTPSRNHLAAALIESLLMMLPEFERQGFGAWRADWNRRHAYAGRSIQIHQGATSYTAEAVEVDHSGNLIVKSEAGLQALTGGEISIRPV
ncbi:biotin--[acetyl-CoA-carboxylase] ligase [Salinicola acroporae]|uniref:Bifunctional ligase/repressor BirA n=1 Tax=Salinicola acroporae TaxID=1541440 RepID=A0ABT6I144_9GAMM|nr:biotin--[acetyl-CoA-carboxylase] ligase [Salinicola acroporae]MDH4571198.1 biotin--[acetyl-CoA-carboxylase] ligase [Salinicola acroporae]